MSLSFTALMVLMTIFLAVNSLDEPDIIFRYADAYEKTYVDKGTGGDMYMGLWRPLVYQKGFCALGDVYSGDKKRAPPAKNTVLVKAGNDGDAVIHPTSFTEVWNDHGSGGTFDVTVYKMNAPAGYTCIGGATVGSYEDEPVKNHYCCVKNEYLVEGQYQNVYKDTGTGASKYLGLWEVIAGADPSGVEASLIVPNGEVGYPAPKDKGYLLKHDHEHVKVVWELLNPPKTALYLYEVTTQLEHIWDDHGSGCTYGDLDIFRATSDPDNGYYSVSDVAVPYWYNENLAFLLKTADKKDKISFSNPLGYTQIWYTDWYKKPIRIWRPVCDDNYMSLGFVATATDNQEPPPIGKIYCIHSDYVTYGNKDNNFELVWRNAGSKGDWVQIFEAVSYKPVEQGIRAMFARKHEYDVPINPYFLKTGNFTHVAEKPVVKVEIYTVTYDLENEDKVKEPASIYKTYVINKSDQQQSCEREVEYTTTKTTSFSFSTSVSFGITTSVTASVPLFASTTTELSQEQTMSFDSGEETSVSKTDSITAKVVVPGKKKMETTITGSKYITDIPYTAAVKKTYFDGTQSFGQTAGIFNGVEVSEITVIYGEALDLTEDDWESDEDDSKSTEVHSEL